MAVDYDIVIIGGSLAGRYAAAAAAQLKATVALVEPSQVSGGILFSPLATNLLPHCLSHIGQLSEQLVSASQFGIHINSTNSAHNCQYEFAQAYQYAQNVVSNLQDQNSPALAAAAGVDFIQGNGQFESKPSLGFVVNGRRLLARSYLIATNSRFAIPEIEGLQAECLTPTQVWQSLASPTPPQRWVILGSDPTGCQIAQTLARFGLDVTLIARSHILPKEDPEIAQLMQAILEAEGVRVLTCKSVTQVKRIDHKKWIQVGNEALEFDEVLLCAGYMPDFAELNLKAVGVKLHKHRLLLNQKLQTTNPRIYACGDAIGGYHFANLAIYEASIALKNALFFPRFKVDYRIIPWVIFSEPQVARVGLTEVQARRIYNRDVLVLQQHFKSVAAAQIKGEITGVCKLIVRRNGMILGAAIVGSQAGELINVIALAIASRLKVDAIATLAPVYPSFSEILQQTAAQFRQAKLNNPNLQNFLEGFFSFRRSYF